MLLGSIKKITQYTDICTREGNFVENDLILIYRFNPLYKHLNILDHAP